MPYYRRHYILDRVIFITCVTKERKPYLQNPQDLKLFWETMRAVQRLHPFHLLAYVIMPDHLHWLMELPDREINFSKVMESIKWNFTYNFKKAHGIQGNIHLWQPRFWDHIIRNELDMERHFDYIHWNPVKHGFVQLPEEWPESTYRHWMEKGYYPSSWGQSEEPANLRGFEAE